MVTSHPLVFCLHWKKTFLFLVESYYWENESNWLNRIQSINKFLENRDQNSLDTSSPWVDLPLVTSGCLLSKKVWWVVRIGSFGQNWGILQTRLDQRVEHIKMNFNYFQIQKWILHTVRAEKVNGKNGVINLVSMFPSWVFPFLPSMVCKLSKKGIFYNFVLTSAINLSLLKQFTYMHLKVLITFFQKMLWFIGVWASIHEILAIKI